MGDDMDYLEFVKSKEFLIDESGIEIDKKEISECLFDYQKDIVKWALRRGKAAVFTGTGSGKTIMQLEFARIITEKENIKALILCPLAVSKQTIAEGNEKLGIKVNDLRENKELKKINIINYEQINNINANEYDCIILDESSILKSFSGTIRN